VFGLDYNKTLNLPKTAFPMRANLPQKEPEILDFWKENQIWQKVLRKNKGKQKFILHDGPPYANGDIHLGTTLNKILKDMINKYKAMVGFDVPFVPGWDTHGLPIEQQVLKSLKIKREEIDVLAFRQACREYALKYVEVQKRQFKRLGVAGDWENPYLTLAKEYEAEQIDLFGQMAQKGYIYRGFKPVYWCTSCKTALAEAETEYKDKSSFSIYVRFKIIEDKGLLPAGDNYGVIWTTTPWTLPANVAISAHPDFFYLLLATSKGNLLLAEDLADQALEEMELVKEKVLGRFKGKDLEGILFQHPFAERKVPLILGGHVTLEQGTGLVHTAPGHGLEDYEVGMRYKLPVLSPLDDHGHFTEEAGKYAGLFYEKANIEIVNDLEKSGALLKSATLQHQFPHCWRCKTPLIFRATKQWFVSIEGFRKEALAAIEEVNWVPSWGEERIRNMIAERSDWCISRQRSWGVPIPIFYCISCGETLITPETIAYVKKLFYENGSDVWFKSEAKDLLPAGTKCPHCGGENFEKENDIMDVWFDSGSSHAAVLRTREELAWPADLYLEGSDQFRGWFNSSLSTSVAVFGRAPYQQVLCHGYVVDEKGRKMSKSLGNGIDPLEVIEELGADVLRLWVASADYTKDIAASKKILRQMSDAYRKIRNTLRFMLGNLYDFDPSQDLVAKDEMLEVDLWAMHTLMDITSQVTSAFEKYEFHSAFHLLYNYCVVDLSARYLDIIKDRLYTELKTGKKRRAAQSVLYYQLDFLVRMLSPILAFTAEEVWQSMPTSFNRPPSVELSSWPEINEGYLDERLGAKYEKIFELKEEVARVWEEAKNKGIITNPLNSKVSLYLDQKWQKEVEGTDLAMLFIVSEVTVAPLLTAPLEAKEALEISGVKITVTPADGKKCVRCWLSSPTVGENPKHPDLCQRCASVVEEILDADLLPREG